MYGYIYKTVNILNEKFYIGQKHADHFLENAYLGSGYHLKSAIKKYGKDNFQVYLLDTADSKAELDEKEIYWIAQLDAQNPAIAYNIAAGGQGGQIVPPHAQTPEECLKRSESLKKAYAEGRHKKISNAGRKPRKRTVEENQANSDRQKGKTWIHNNDLQKQKTVLPDALEQYLAEGWELGRFPNNKPAWNKGLNKDTNETLKAASEKRKKLFEERGVVGCFGVKGNQNGFKKGDTPWNKGQHESTHNLSKKRKENK